MSAYQRLLAFLFPKSIATNLVEACAAVSKVKKLGNNGEYSYLRIVDIADALREEIFSRGILIIPNDIECNVAKFKVPDSDNAALSGRVITEVRIKTQFTITDGKQSLVFIGYGVGRDMDGKALFAAQTGALKSWLKRLALIFGDRDDPEVEARTAPQTQQEQDDELPRQKLAQARYQSRAWSAALATCGRTQTEIETLLSEAMGRPVTSDSIIALPREGFDVAMKLLTQHSDMTQVLEQSKRIVKRKRANGSPQPIVDALDHQPVDEMTGD
jgi:hypothetical protein